GFDAFLKLFERNRALVLRVMVLALTVIWFASSSFICIESSYQDASFINQFFQSRGFIQTENWVQDQMKTNDIGATDYAPHFSYYAHRYFYSLASLNETAHTTGIPLGDYLHELHVKYVIATKEFVQRTQLFGIQNILQNVTTIGDFEIYVVV